ncbi:response regulator [Caulobacter sp. 17J65-9]|uniref:response regulator n=1 Tax=Caulobacter sp. 17J65-9 TaxID=2709382 RepID=UPI0013CD25C8|nr:response regulator [Caulobacter sp. 17J65-9]NEX91781.1 response regulator [Caulobacter sp. 17J65-9]
MTERPLVLVVDDEVMIRILAVDLLDELDAEALEAGTAGEALEVAQDRVGELACALVDLGLPDRPGEELVADLRRLAPDLPIVVTSGQSVGHVRAAFGDGVHVLEKPYQLADLERVFGELGLDAGATAA